MYVVQQMFQRVILGCHFYKATNSVDGTSNIVDEFNIKINNVSLS